MTEGLLNTETDAVVDNPPVTTDWKGTLPKEVLTHVDRFKTADELAKGYAELNSAMGSRVKIPDDKSTPEELNKFYEKLGRPAAPDKYVLERPKDLPETMQYDEKFEARIRNVGFQNGANQKLMKALYDEYNVYQKEVYEGVEKQIKDEIAKHETELKDKWKADYNKNIEIGNRAKDTLLTEDFKHFLTDSNLIDSPLVKEQLYNLGTKMLDDSLVRGTQPKPEDYVPAYPSSPEMYRNDNSEEGQKARKYFTEVKNYKY